MCRHKEHTLPLFAAYTSEANSLSLGSTLLIASKSAPYSLEKRQTHNNNPAKTNHPPSGTGIKKAPPRDITSEGGNSFIFIKVVT